MGGAWEHAAASSAAVRAMRMAASRGARGAHPISFPFHLHDGQLHLAGRPADAHRVSLALAEERAPQRRFVADAARTKVVGKLVAADDLVGGLLAVLVLHGDRRAEERAPHGLPGDPGAVLVEQHAELLAEPLETCLGDVALPGRRTLHAPPCCLKLRNGATSLEDVHRGYPGDPG